MKYDELVKTKVENYSPLELRDLLKQLKLKGGGVVQAYRVYCWAAVGDGCYILSNKKAVLQCLKMSASEVKIPVVAGPLDTGTVTFYIGGPAT